VSADPIGIKGGINDYIYSKNNTVINTDRGGLQADAGVICERAGGVDGPCDYERPAPPPPPTPEQTAALNEGRRLGVQYGQFEADLEQFNNAIHRKWGGVSLWDRLSATERQQFTNNVIREYNRLPPLTAHFSDPAVSDFALRGFNESRVGTYSSASTWNTIRNFLLEMAPFFAVGIISALRRAGASIVIDLFGGQSSQIAGAINVDIAATSGIRANATRLPLATGVADEVIATNPYIPGLPAGSNAANTWLPEATRILRPGGRLTVTGALGANKFARLPATEELERLGLRVVQVHKQ
jgi:hypothetical protein